MDREKDGIRNFELATRRGNERKSANSGLSRNAERQFETFGSRVSTDKYMGKTVIFQGGRQKMICFLFFIHGESARLMYIMTRLPKVPPMNFCSDRKKDWIGSLRRLPDLSGRSLGEDRSGNRRKCSGSGLLRDEKRHNGSFGRRVHYDVTAKSNKAGFRMNREKDGIRNFELATCSGNGRKSANSGLLRDAGRQFETFGSCVHYVCQKKREESTMNDDVKIYEKQFADPGIPHTGMPADELFKQAAAEMERQSTLSPRLRKLSTFQFLLDNMRVGSAEKEDLFPVFGVWGRKGYDLLYSKNWSSLQACLKDAGEIFSRQDVAWIGPDYAHSVPDWQTVLELGFSGLLARAKRKEAEYFARHEKGAAGLSAVAPQEKQDFFFSVIQAYETVLRAMKRLADVQQEMQSAPEMVQALRNLTVGHARTMHEALLQIWLFHQIAEYADGIETRSFGNLDQLLYPYYQRDCERGVSEAHFRRILHNFMAKVMATRYYYGHPMYLGGTKTDGSSAVNELSYMILDEYGRAGFHDPKIQAKINLNTPVPFLNKLLDMIRRGHNSLVLVGEPGIRKAMLKHGFSEEDARCAVIKGCYEYTELHSSVETAPTRLVLPQMVVNVLRDCPDVPDFETFLVRLREHVRLVCEKTVFFINRVESMLEKINPSLMLSGVTESAVSRGLDGYAGGALHNNTNVWCMGPATAGDSLCMIRKYVFEQKKITIPELLRAMDANWAGYERLHEQLLNDPEKYGSNMPEADRMLKQFLHFLTENINGKANSRGGIFTTALHSADMFFTYAKEMGATPDGRRHGEEYSKNISPQPGQGRRGVTALIQSALSLDPGDYMGDFPLDVMLHSSAVQGEEGLHALQTLVMTYIRNFGHAIHFNVFSVEQLRDAAAHPEKYPELQVRVCGWNVYWSHLSPAERHAYILQAAAGEKGKG